MTIDKAIEVLTEITNYTKYLPSPRQMGALKLGIEALKWHQDIRKLEGVALSPLLPGETKE